VAIRGNRAKDGRVSALFLDHPGAVLGAFGGRSSACRREPEGRPRSPAKRDGPGLD
jgi:hypothetical protein